MHCSKHLSVLWSESQTSPLGLLGKAEVQLLIFPHLYTCQFQVRQHCWEAEERPWVADSDLGWISVPFKVPLGNLFHVSKSQFPSNEMGMTMPASDSTQTGNEEGRAIGWPTVKEWWVSPQLLLSYSVCLAVTKFQRLRGRNIFPTVQELEKSELQADQVSGEGLLSGSQLKTSHFFFTW